MWLHLTSDSLIGVAYFSIPFTLAYFVYKRRDLPFSWMFVLFGLFIIACGSTHWMEVWTLWYPDYWLSGAIKAFTAAASLPTAVALMFLVPRALTIPGAGQLRAMNESLAMEMARRQRIEDDLRKVQLELEAQVTARTHELADVNRDLERQREWLQVTLSSIGDAVIATDRQAKIAFMNGVAEELTGWCQQEAEGKPLEQVFRAVDVSTRTAIENPALQTVQEGRIVRPDHHRLLMPKGGSEIPINDSAAPIRDSSGHTIGAVLIFRDITKERQAEQAISERERFLQTVLDNTPGLIYVKDADGRFLLVNRRVSDAVGIPAEQLLGRIEPDIFGDSSFANAILQNDQQILRGEEVVELEERLELSDGIHTYLSIKVPAEGVGFPGRVLCGFSLDITERKRAEAQLDESRELFQAFMDHSPARSWIKDEEGRYAFMSLAVQTALKLTPQDWLGKTAFDLHPFHLAEAISANDRLVLENSKPQRFVEEIVQNGEHRFLLSHKFCMVRGGRPHVAGTAIDITEQIRAERALRDADSRKNEFLATLAHELRNPLSPIRSAVAVIQRLGPPDAKLLKLSEIIDRQAKHMARLLDDLMDVSRITQNRIELRKEKITLSSAISAALEACSPLIEAKNHDLQLTLPPEPLELYADPTRLVQVLSNLLNNAAKYTDPGGRISLTAVCDAENVRISVKDNGIGIDPTHLPKLFEMFSQATSALDRAGGGLGIGLALTRGLVEAHGGRVEAHSAGLGTGSEFILHLPSVASNRRAAPNEQTSIAEAHRRPPFRILIAEDNRDAADMLAEVLKLSGDTVQVVSDGDSVSEACIAFRPDVVILDIGLPGLNGYQVARKIRAETWGQSLLLIALTGWGQEEDKRRATEAGFDHHLTKPIDQQTLENFFASAGVVSLHK
jgi:PAS domain S-box-containing protein